jgi:SNF2 family DNA or RNA helicase
MDLVRHLSFLQQLFLSLSFVTIFLVLARMLELLPKKLMAEGFKFLIYDGQLCLVDREKVLQEFRTSPDITLLLMSLKAGGVGINLSVANYVFFLDLWWHRQTENQAIDRVHRVGQQRDVKVVRITVRDTIEQKILSLQEKKRKLAEGALGTSSLQNLGRLTLDDLKFLFRVTGP